MQIEKTIWYSGCDFQDNCLIITVCTVPVRMFQMSNGKISHGPGHAKGMLKASLVLWDRVQIANQAISI
jgi:hypothetical protein